MAKKQKSFADKAAGNASGDSVYVKYVKSVQSEATGRWRFNEQIVRMNKGEQLDAALKRMDEAANLVDIDLSEFVSSADEKPDTVPKKESKDRELALKEYTNFSSKTFIPIRKLGSAALDMAYVAAGRCDGFWQRNLNYWDIAAGIILVKESGGFVTDFYGENKYLENKTILATNSKIRNEMIEVLK